MVEVALRKTKATECAFRRKACKFLEIERALMKHMRKMRNSGYTRSTEIQSSIICSYSYNSYIAKVAIKTKRIWEVGFVRVT